VLDTGQAGDIWQVLANVPASALYPIAFIGRIFLPIRPAVYPVMDWSQVGWGAAALALLLLVVGRLGVKDKRLVIFGAAWLVIFMLPTLARKADVPGGMPIPEARYYIAGIGSGFLFAGLDWERAPAWFLDNLAAFRWGLLALLSAVTFWHSGHYRDRLSFWTDAVRTSPSSAFCRNNLGAMYYVDGDSAQALRAWLEAERLDPKERLVHGNLGLLYQHMGRFEDAAKEYVDELAVNPRYESALFNLGLLNYGRGDWSAAAQWWERALQVNPNHQASYEGLVVCYFRAGKKELAGRTLDLMRAKGFAVSPQLESLAGGRR
jgi:tetratricopeptide (TPR) repeat protein